MQFDPSNFLTHIKNLVTGGGATKIDRGFIVDKFVPLSAVDLNTTRTVDTSDAGAAADPVVETGAYLADDETNARVIHVDEATDTIGRLSFPIPRDYDEEADILRVRVLASQVSVSTDNDVELDSNLYKKTAGTALGSDIAPAAPGTVLTAAEQWIEFDYTGLGEFLRDDVVNFRLITNGANDTNGEEVLIHAIQVSYASTLVSYDDENDASGNCLR